LKAFAQCQGGKHFVCIMLTFDAQLRTHFSRNWLSNRNAYGSHCNANV